MVTPPPVPPVEAVWSVAVVEGGDGAGDVGRGDAGGETGGGPGGFLQIGDFVGDGPIGHIFRAPMIARYIAIFVDSADCRINILLQFYIIPGRLLTVPLPANRRISPAAIVPR